MKNRKYTLGLGLIALIVFGAALIWCLKPRNNLITEFERDGATLIFIVGFCEPVDVDWRNELVSSPMTNCYFEAQYDIGEQHILYLWSQSDL